MRIPLLLLLGMIFPWSNHAVTVDNIPVSRHVLTTPAEGPDLFVDEAILDIRLSGNLKDLMNDRDETPADHPVEFSYANADSSRVSMNITARTRGHFRKSMGNCTYPPILLVFPEKAAPAQSLFAGQAKLKLVVPCAGDDYVVREWMIYKLYNLVTDKSFRARLVRIELNDTQRKKKTGPFYGFLLEDDSEMAKRNHMTKVDRKMLRMEQTEPATFLQMAVFEYLIGNTDWSVQYQQNIKLLADDPNGIPYPVPYDFDHAGLVSAPYANPAEELQLRSVRERRYRGYCITDMSQFKETVALYNRLKDAIYKLYTANPLLDAKYVKATVQYLDEFYATINNEKKLKSEFGYPCDKNGTGNIIIQGLKNNPQQ